MFPDNVLFVGETLSGVIDYYFACNDYFAYDLAIALNAWCFEPDGAFNVTKGKALIAGYESRRQLTDAEIRMLPLRSEEPTSEPPSLMRSSNALLCLKTNKNH